jgi:hypothetical protein
MQTSHLSPVAGVTSTQYSRSQSMAQGPVPQRQPWTIEMRSWRPEGSLSWQQPMQSSWFSKKHGLSLGGGPASKVSASTVEESADGPITTSLEEPPSPEPATVPPQAETDREKQIAGVQKTHDTKRHRWTWPRIKTIALNGQAILL